MAEERSDSPSNSPPSKSRSRARRVAPGLVAAYVVLGGLAFAVLFPVLWIVAQSFMQEWQIYRWPITFIPTPPTLDNYSSLFLPRPDRPPLPISRWLLEQRLRSFRRDRPRRDRGGAGGLRLRAL